VGETRRGARLRIEAVGYGDPDVVRLVAAVQEEYVQRYGGPDETPLDPLMFVPPAGRFFVGYEDDEPVAMGAWRRREVAALGATDTAEVKRMYVVPPARGRGHARTVLAHLEATAAEAGVDALVLETGEAQPEAIALYESAGYVPIEGFGIYRCSPLSRYYGRRLTPPA
jgi:GNAT superfamily N-acetyltransferase